MNKRITSLVLVFVMVLSLLATAVPVLAAPVGPNDAEYSVEADKTSAAPGEEIKFTVYIQQNGNLNVIEARLKIPTGLTYIPDSGALAENIQATLGWDATDWTPDPYMMVNGFGAESYTGTDKLALMTFKCTVDSDTPAGDYEVTLHEFFTGDDTYIEKPTTCIPATITVTAAPKPATDITLDREELTLTVGDTETLVATVTPSDTTDTVAWSSDKPEVATVDPTTGEVTAVAPGEAIITAKAGSVYATCTAKVEAAPCTHVNKTTIPEKASDCTNKGWDKYQKCDDCGALFDMSGGSRSDIPYRALDPNTHTFGGWIDEVPANCTNTGTKGHKDCTLCHKHFDNYGAEIVDLTIPTNGIHDFDTTTWGYKESDGHAHVCKYNPAHHDTVEAHNFGSDDTCDICGYERTHVCANHLTKVEEKLADCTNPGNIEHYKCSCGKLYEDATAARELTEEDVNRGALGHDWIDATCTEPKTCDRCGETEGTALGHNWATEWSSNADNHWHACTRCDAKDGEGAHNPGAPATETTPQICTDCGYVIESATGHVCANHLTKVDRVEADCTTPGNIEHYKCSGDTGCGKLYEDRTASVPLTEEQVKLNALGHDWATEWSSNADNHWHACSRCDAKDGEGAHNPGAPATETTPQTCTDCGYVIDPATGHLCINHLVEVPEVPATCTTTGTEAHFKCTDPACGKLYWDDDAHDEITDPSELVIDALDHAWADTWSKDEHNHWHACSRCDAKADEAAHTPDHPDGATFEYPVLCVECGYEMEAQREEGTIRVELPFKLTVKKTGELDPGKEIFKFMAEEFGAPVEYELITSTLETNGAKTYEGIFIFTIMEGDAGNLSEGFIFRQVKGDAEGWTYDETKFYAVPIYNENGDGVEFWNIYYLDEEGMPDEDNRPNGVSFTNSYNAKKPVEPTEPSEPSEPSEPPTPDESNPQTGDNGNLALWIVLLIASGSAVVSSIFRKMQQV